MDGEDDEQKVVDDVDDDEQTAASVRGSGRAHEQRRQHQFAFIYIF